MVPKYAKIFVLGHYAPINVKLLGGGRPGIGRGFDSSHCPIVGTFDRFNGLSSNILLTFVDILTIHKCPGVGHFNETLSSVQMPRLCPASPPSSLTLIGALSVPQSSH